MQCKLDKATYQSDTGPHATAPMKIPNTIIVESNGALSLSSQTRSNYKMQSQQYQNQIEKEKEKGREGD